MTITLSDLTAAPASYIDNEVDVRIADVTANLNPGEEGTYTVGEQLWSVGVLPEAARIISW